MLVSFSDYIKNKGPKLRLYSARELARVWFNQCCQAMATLKDFVPLAVLESLLKGRLSADEFPIEAELEVLLQQSTEVKVLIETLDRYFAQLVKHLGEVAQVYLNRQPVKMPESFYPFSPSQSGVGITCRLRDANGNVLFSFEPAFGAVGSANPKTVISNVRKNHSGAERLNNIMTGVFDRNLADHVDFKSPHAEDHFFVCNSELLFDAANENNKQLNNNFAGDTMPLSFLVGARIEFVLSTSPCVDCQGYFKALRHQLNEMGVYTPIVIYANSMCNSSEDRDGAIFIIDYSGKYRLLSFPWLAPKLGKVRVAPNNAALVKYVERHRPLTALSQRYYAILILTIFGDALLPRVARLPPIMLRSFLQSMLSDSRTSHVMACWVRFYFCRTLRMQPFDFSETAVKRLDTSEEYEEVDLNFLRHYRELTDLESFIKYVTQLASHKNNALVFFMCLVQMWHPMIYQSLVLPHEPKLSSLKANDKLAGQVCFVRSVMFWDSKTAPPEVLHHFENSRDGVSAIVSSQKVLDTWRRIGDVGRYLHYIEVEDCYRDQILNSTLTAPPYFPLPGENTNYSDRDISILIYKIRTAIVRLACPEGCWNLAVMEEIFNAFNCQRLTSGLEAEIKKIPESKKFALYSRVFSKEQLVWSIKEGDSARIKSLGSLPKLA